MHIIKMTATYLYILYIYYYNIIALLHWYGFLCTQSQSVNVTMYALSSRVGFSLCLYSRPHDAKYTVVCVYAIS